MKQDPNEYQASLPIFSTTPAVFASLSDEGRSRLEGLVMIQEDPEWQLLIPQSGPQPRKLAIVS